MTFRNKRNRDPAHPVPGSEWPFPDDLDDYERELEASSARGEWKQVVNHEAELNRYQEMPAQHARQGTAARFPTAFPYDGIAGLQYSRQEG